MTETSWREELIRRLESADPPTLLETFVLLWSYFEEAGLRMAEDRLSELKIHPERTRVIDLPETETQRVRWFQEKRRTLISLDEGEMDCFAVRWLSDIDQWLGRTERREKVEFSGLDVRKVYRVHRRREILAETLVQAGRRGTAWVGYQGDAIEAYTRFHKAVRVGEVRGYKIVHRSFGRRGQSKLRARLALDWEDGHFRVMLWPIEIRLEYLGLDEQDLSQGSGGTPVNYVHLRDLKNGDKLLEEIPRMLAAAQKEKATLLLLPELAVPPTVEREIKRLLAGRSDHGHPLLTLFGRCHRQVSDGVDVNEAILLGPDGKKVLCHRKLVQYTGPADKRRTIYFSENLKRGNRITVLELPFGNLSVAICADFFRKKELLGESHATLLAVPSLSRKTSAHKTAAVELMNRNRACTFVTNRWIDDKEPLKATSFYQLPFEDEEGEGGEIVFRGYEAHLKEPSKGESPPPSPPFLLFSLR